MSKSKENDFSYETIGLAVVTAVATLFALHGIQEMAPASGNLVQGLRSYIDVASNWISHSQADEINQVRAFTVLIWPVIFAGLTGGSYTLHRQSQAK